jgi:hypothetical protein
VTRESAPKYGGADPVRGCRRHPVAVDRPPQPAVGRDAAHGVLGRYLVARIFVAHGWPVDGGRKHVWARIDATGAETRQAGPESAPWPRNGSAGDSPALTVPARTVEAGKSNSSILGSSWQGNLPQLPVVAANSDAVRHRPSLVPVRQRGGGRVLGHVDDRLGGRTNRAVGRGEVIRVRDCFGSGRRVRAGHLPALEAGERGTAAARTRAWRGVRGIRTVEKVAVGALAAQAAQRMELGGGSTSSACSLGPSGGRVARDLRTSRIEQNDSCRREGLSPG